MSHVPFVTCKRQKINGTASLTNGNCTAVTGAALGPQDQNQTPIQAARKACNVIVPIHLRSVFQKPVAPLIYAVQNTSSFRPSITSRHLPPTPPQSTPVQSRSSSVSTVNPRTRNNGPSQTVVQQMSSNLSGAAAPSTGIAGAYKKIPQMRPQTSPRVSTPQNGVGAGQSQQDKSKESLHKKSADNFNELTQTSLSLRPDSAAASKGGKRIGKAGGQSPAELAKTEVLPAKQQRYRPLHECYGQKGTAKQSKVAPPEGCKVERKVLHRNSSLSSDPANAAPAGGDMRKGGYTQAPHALLNALGLGHLSLSLQDAASKYLEELQSSLRPFASRAQPTTRKAPPQLQQNTVLRAGPSQSEKPSSSKANPNCTSGKRKAEKPLEKSNEAGEEPRERKQRGETDVEKNGDSKAKPDQACMQENPPERQATLKAVPAQSIDSQRGESTAKRKTGEQLLEVSELHKPDPVLDNATTSQKDRSTMLDDSAGKKKGGQKRKGTPHKNNFAAGAAQLQQRPMTKRLSTLKANKELDQKARSEMAPRTKCEAKGVPVYFYPTTPPQRPEKMPVHRELERDLIRVKDTASIWGAVQTRARSGFQTRTIPVHEGFHISSITDPNFKLGMQPFKYCFPLEGPNAFEPRKIIREGRRPPRKFPDSCCSE